ncbi:ParD-like family protein [Pseudomonas bohemica]|uniref:ParD-like family protein n=1 Tax=Pseudomonas bohemica TaxID=2044872 RepID=UPI000DA5F73C|nr:ParD-like family protein [Pseudomonas bohemica]
MGLVKISEQMHANIRAASAALSRSINAQAEHWMRVGMLAELNPGLNYADICQLLIRAEAGGDALLGEQSDQPASHEPHVKAVSK